MSRQINLGQVVPNIQIGTTITKAPGTSAEVENVGTELNPILNFYIPKGEPGVINLLIVNELPQVGRSDTLYFVPKEDAETSDLYDEYVWIDNEWELIGEKQITIDLSDYYTKQEVNNLIPPQLSELNSDSTHRTVSDTEKSTWNDKVDTSTYNSKMTQIDTSLGNKLEESDLADYVKKTDYASGSTGGVIKAANGFNVGSTGNANCTQYNYATYGTIEGYCFISKGTLENVIAGKQLVNKTYVDGLVGDIGEVLDTIQGEVI